MRRTIMKLGIALALLVGGGGVSLAQTSDTADAGLAAYEQGDYAKAVREWSILAEQGDKWAQFNLGLLYTNGQGVAQDYQEAVRWYRLSAEQGNALAQYNLGVAYANGQGFAQNFKEAVRLYQLSAEQGQAAAQYNLGVAYTNGQGVRQDYVYALMWLRIAATGGFQRAAKNRDLIAARMTAAQVARAQELAKQCVAKNYKGC